VVDLMNYWPPVDGVLPEFEGARPSSQVVGDALPPAARLVKTLNHIGYHEIEELARPAGAAGRVALAVAGDDLDAVETVAHLVDDLGFDAVPIGGLAGSTALQPGSPIFGADLGETAMRAELSATLERNDLVRGRTGDHR
jgi:predicted dinucleotide-binding enzyme